MSTWNLCTGQVVINVTMNKEDPARPPSHLTLTLGPRRFKEMSPYIISPMGINRNNDKNNANQKEAKNGHISDFTERMPAKNISMCNQMVTSEIRERLGKLLGFGQNASEIRE